MSSRRCPLGCSLLLVAALVAVPGAGVARKPKPEPCAPGRYLVAATSSPLLDGVSPAIDAITVDARGAVTLDGCGPASKAAVKAKRTFTVVKAKWATCGTFAKVSVKGKIASPACETLSAKLKAKKLKKKTFSAGRGRCGDTRMDGGGGETCDASAPGGDAGCPGACPAFDAATACQCPGGSGAICGQLGLATLPFSTSSTGTHRGDVAADFTVPLVGGAQFGLAATWLGCESHVFIPDTIDASELDSDSIWENDLGELITRSPRNVHYFFVSRAAADDPAATATAAMQQRIADVLATLAPPDAVHWQAHLHVVDGRAATLGNWLTDVLAGHGRFGFTIDPTQRVRGLGFLADVTRYRDALQSAGHWPWERNLAYAAYDAQWGNAEAARAAHLAADGATVVPLWQGETLETSAEVDVALPSAGEMASFDTLEVDIALACPDPELPEPGNCGVWDYLTFLTVTTPDGPREVARGVTSFHRESHWVVNATHVLPLLAAGGTHHFKWDFAPVFNPQPTITRIALRFSSRGVGRRPTAATFLWSGGPFNSAYNVGRSPANVPIPATATRVELVAIISGHGGNPANNCAEFCDHEHDFTVGSTVHVASFPGATSEDGCVAEVANGLTPNQSGTWWFGRGGWCPGQQVTPWVFDVTGDVTPGTTATISYEGLFENATPPDNSGNIELSSWLVVYE